MDVKHFTKTEAEAKVGRKIRTSVAWSGVPKGTTGTVERADSVGLVRPSVGEAFEGHNVGIRWDLQVEPQVSPTLTASSVPIVAIRSGKPLVDWFTKAEYEKYLVEL